MDAVQLTSVTKYFGSTIAVDDLSLAVPESGKTRLCSADLQVVLPKRRWLRQIVGMAVPLELLRALLGLLSVFFAVMLGRSGAAVFRRQGRRSRMYAWLVRLAITLFAIEWRHNVDALMLAVIVAVVLAAAGGVWIELRPRQEEEDPGKQIFR
jgi:hypothetical protein